ncbi:MAG: asparaginase [Flavobacteriales bacterium]
MGNKPAVLLLYTGGTIGMARDPETGALRPAELKELRAQVPELEKLDLQLDSQAFEEPIDSSDMTPELWKKLARIIQDRYEEFDGFVILHGTDTMAYTASALSFMLENLGKPVILTGSQLPMEILRTDAKENLLTSIEIASSYRAGKPLIPEVGIYFEFKLLRGNRTYKFNAEHFDAFRSDNYPPLGNVGVRIDIHEDRSLPLPDGALKVHERLGDQVGVLTLFPGIRREEVERALQAPGLRVLVLQTFGAGNAPTFPWFRSLIQEAVQRGSSILNITQCRAGPSIQGSYEASKELERSGVIEGCDMTLEAAITKSMFLLGNDPDQKELDKLLATPLRGELTLPSKENEHE